MATEKQLNANRRNSQKSTGPRTVNGKASARLNALQHGLTAATAVLPHEEATEFNETLQAFLAEHQPVGPTENSLVHQIVMCVWRLRRCRLVEMGLFDFRLCDCHPEMELNYSDISGPCRLAFVYHKDSLTAGSLATLSRHEARIERALYRALNELRRSQTLRGAVPAAARELASFCKKA